MFGVCVCVARATLTPTHTLNTYLRKLESWDQYGGMCVLVYFTFFCKFLAGSFSAVSKRNFARKYAFDSIFQALQDLHTFAPLESNRKTMKSASGKRPPDKAHNAPEKKLSCRINWA